MHTRTPTFIRPTRAYTFHRVGTLVYTSPAWRVSANRDFDIRISRYSLIRLPSINGDIDNDRGRVQSFLFLPFLFSFPLFREELLHEQEENISRAKIVVKHNLLHHTTSLSWYLWSIVFKRKTISIQLSSFTWMNLNLYNSRVCIEEHAKKKKRTNDSATSISILVHTPRVKRFDLSKRPSKWWKKKTFYAGLH